MKMDKHIYTDDPMENTFYQMIDKQEMYKYLNRRRKRGMKAMLWLFLLLLLYFVAFAIILGLGVRGSVEDSESRIDALGDAFCWSNEKGYFVDQDLYDDVLRIKCEYRIYNWKIDGE